MADEAQQVISCQSEAHFNELLNTNKLIIVDFTASWCGPCRFIAPILVELAKKFVDAIFVKVDVDKLGVLSKKYNVQAMPTFMFFKEGNLLTGEDIVGAKKDELCKTVEKLYVPSASLSAA